MKKIFLSACFVSSAFAYINAQTNDVIGTSNTKTIFSNATVQYTDSMPNALAGKNYTFNYLGNNGNGLGFYQSSVDNMVVAKADSGFHSNMPVLKKETNPNKLDSLIELLKKKKEQSQQSNKPLSYNFNLNNLHTPPIKTDTLLLYKKLQIIKPQGN